MDTPVRIEEVTKRYDGDGGPALNEVSLEVGVGEAVATTGPSGSGRSTLLNLMLGKATILAITLGALGLLAGGCGGGKSPSGVAALGPATTSSSPNAAGGAQSQTPVSDADRTAWVAFVNCLQKHGIQAQLGQGGQGVSISGGHGPGQFSAAQKACQKLLPGGGPKPLTPAERAQNVIGLAKLAACMRTHGYPSFPDATSQGVFNLSSAIDPNSTQFQAAMNTCQPKGARLRFAIAG